MDRLTCIVCRPTPSGLSHTQCHHACTLADDPLCRWDCTSHVNPPTYTATWGRANAPAPSGGIITEPALQFTATYSLYVHIIAASNFRVTVNGQIASPSDITLLSDPSTPTTELVIGVALAFASLGTTSALWLLLTGVAFKFSVLVLAYTYGQAWIALLMVLIGTLVLGMGMTVTADYLILAVLAVPSLGELGVPLMAAHLSVFWFSQSSNVTPPVCMAAFAGASIAEAGPYRTGFTAMRFSAYLYLMPFMFVYTPILMPEGLTGEVIYTWIILFGAVVPFAAGMTGQLFGPMPAYQRVALVDNTFAHLCRNKGNIRLIDKRAQHLGGYFTVGRCADQ